MAAWMLLVLASLWIPAAAADVDVSCVITKSCVLPCSFKSGRDPIVQWRKDPSDITVHSFQTGQDQLIDQDPDYRGHTSLFKDEISRGNASLLLSGLRLTDQGQYRCFTGTANTDSKTSFINLRVEGAVGPVSIEQSGDVLLCSSENIYLKPSVSWSRSPPSQSEPTSSVQESKEQVYSVSSTVPLPPSPPLEYTCNISTVHSWRSAIYSWRPGLSPAVKGVIVFSVFFIIIMVVVIVGFYCRRKHKRRFNSHLSRLCEHLPLLPAEGVIWLYQYKLKSELETRFKFLTEGNTESESLFNERYTEMYVTIVNTGQMKTCEDIFKGQTNERKPIRTVLTMGEATIGKTTLTRKFSLDWAEGRANQNIQLLFPFTFRELNVLRDRRFSLVGLLQHFFSESKGLSFEDLQVVFIFDGLDECRLCLDFTQTQDLTDPTESVLVDVLLVNLIRGSLLPSAHLWITTRPAAANQIPAECVSMVTEVRGFSDPQKKQYFRKRFTDEKQATAVISHIKKTHVLHTMCHIPFFCWILAIVIENMMKYSEEPKLPQSLTELYICFLVAQVKVKNIKYDQCSERDPPWTPETRKMAESLGKLAFEQLQERCLISSKSDLRQCGLEPTEPSVYSGVFTQVFGEEPGLYQDKVYWFTHLSVQEFLAALHIHQSFVKTGVNLLLTRHRSETSSIHTYDSESPETEGFYHFAVLKALKSPNGNLDLFLRFLLGLSLSTNQSLLQGLLTQTGSERTNQKTVNYIKTKLSQDVSAERNLNLFYCLNELNDHSLVKEIQRYMRERLLSGRDMSPAQWSALAFFLLSLDTDREEFDLRKYHRSERALQNLLPVVKASAKAMLSSCGLSQEICGPLSSVLSSSSLTLLDLSNNNLQDSGVKLLCEGLKSPPCRLETLSLSRCGLSQKICGPLSSVLGSSSLTLLDLSYNDLQNSGVKLLCEGLKSGTCRLETLRLISCGLFQEACGPLSSVLRSSSLTLLDLSDNNLQNSGVELLCEGLKSATCILETLRLSECMVGGEGGASLASALSSAHSRLSQLDLSYNNPGPSVMKDLTTLQEDPHCPLNTLRLTPAGEEWMTPGIRKYYCGLTLDPNTAHRHVKLSENIRRVANVREEQKYPDHPDRFTNQTQVLCSTPLTGRCYWEVDWSGRDVSIAVSYKGIKRTGDREDCEFGENGHSWSLEIFKGHYSARHNKEETWRSPSDQRSGTIGVFLDSEAGVLSFYEVKNIHQFLLHKFNTSFTEPLYAGFMVGSEGDLVSLDVGEFFEFEQC